MDAGVLFRELSAVLSPTATSSGGAEPSCSPAVHLPDNGILMLPGGEIMTLTAGAAFKPACTPNSLPLIIASGGGSGIMVDESDSSNSSDDSSLTTSDFRDPFYASTFPQCYALAATTVVAYTLVIMLWITPRSFLNGSVIVLGRRRFTDGGAGGQDIGGRPWLQKTAALTVAVSLTIASINTFRVAEYQYTIGVPDANSLQTQVMDSTELKTIRIISDTFLWLAQAQTLIRLFPRQREKVIIKWTAFALVTLDVVFQSLDSFLYSAVGGNKPQNFTEAVPALSYLFQLTLGVLYAAWVIYYALMKKRYAFYHPQMKNICLVAILSLLAILVPVVFFVLDISQPDFTGWGDYVRWVGAAAASVIVWEWVERIEALEREEKKDGILGREVFDGDEMLEITAADPDWPRRRKDRINRSGDDGEGGGDGGRETLAGGRSNIWPHMSSTATQYRSRLRPRDPDQPGEPPNTESSNNERAGTAQPLQPPLWSARAVSVVTPVSRTDTASAASTVYAVRYQPMTETSGTTPPPPPPPDQPPPLSRSSSLTSSHHSTGEARSGPIPTSTSPRTSTVVERESNPPSSVPQKWRPFAQAGNPLRRFGRPSSSSSSNDRPSRPAREERERVQHGHDETGRWDIKARLEEFAMTQAERLRERMRPTPDTENLPVRVIPAPPRRGTALAQLLEEEEEQDGGQGSSSRSAEAVAAGAPAWTPRERRTGSTSSHPSREGAVPAPVPTPAAAAAAATAAGPAPALWRSNSGYSASSRSRPNGTAHSEPLRPTNRAGPAIQWDVGRPTGVPSQVALGKQPADPALRDGLSRSS